MGLRPINKGPGGGSGGGGGGGELPEGFIEYVQTIAINATAAKNAANEAKAAVAEKATQADVEAALNPVRTDVTEALNRTEILKAVDEFQAAIIAEKATQADIDASLAEILPIQ